MPSPERSTADNGSDRDPRGERLLAAAREMFLEKGYAATSMDQVAKAARASKTTLYTRFPSKEELFAAVIRRECEVWGATFPADAFDHIPFEEALLTIGRRMVGLLWSDAALHIHQVVQGEAMRQPAVAKAFHDNGPAPTLAAVAGFFARARDTGRWDIPDPEFAAEQFMAALEGGAHCQLSMGLCGIPSDEERERHVTRVVALFLRGISAAR